MIQGRMQVPVWPAWRATGIDGCSGTYEGKRLENVLAVSRITRE